jgi:hypothetical protein
MFGGTLRPALPGKVAADVRHACRSYTWAKSTQELAVVIGIKDRSDEDTAREVVLGTSLLVGQRCVFQGYAQGRT